MINSKYIFAILISLTFSHFLFGQDTLSSIQLDTIKGQVLDSKTKESLIFATVVIFKSGSETLLTGVETDLDGYFSFIVEKGDYDILVRYPKYKSHKIIGITVNGTVVKSIELSEGTDEIGFISIGGFNDYELLFRHDRTTSGRKFKAKDIEKSPLKW